MMEVHLSCSLWLLRPRSIPKASNANEMPMKKEGLSLCDPSISLIYHRNQRQSITRNSYFFVCSKKGRKEGVVPVLAKYETTRMRLSLKLDSPKNQLLAATASSKDTRYVISIFRNVQMGINISWWSSGRWKPHGCKEKGEKEKDGKKTHWATPVTPVDSVDVSLTHFFEWGLKGTELQYFPDIFVRLLSLEPKSNFPHLTESNMDLGRGSMSKKIHSFKNECSGAVVASRRAEYRQSVRFPGMQHSHAKTSTFELHQWVSMHGSITQADAIKISPCSMLVDLLISFSTHK